MSITQNKRLHILYDDYSINPTKTILSFIGTDAEIIKITENSIISDGYMVVDVEYKVLDLDQTNIYYIKFGDCRKINMKKEHCYIANIDGINVCLNIRNQNLTKDSLLPITINPVIPTTREQTMYKYYGFIIDSPFHYCNSQMFSFNHELKTLDECLKCSKDKKIFSDDKIKMSYTEVIGKLPFNARSSSIEASNIKHINSIDEVGDDKYYIIDIRKLNTDIGLISAVKYREHPWDVLYIPISNYKITKRKYNNMISYMYADYQHYIKWIDIFNN